MELSIGESKNSPHVKGDFSRSVEGLPSFDVALRIVDKSHWIDKALVFAPALLPQGKAGPEPVQTGVYRLQGPRQDREDDMRYVGKGYLIRSLAAHRARVLWLSPN